MSKSARKITLSTLQRLLSPNEGILYEKKIFEMASYLAVANDTDLEKEYDLLAYEKCGEVATATSRDKLLEDLQDFVSGWESSSYDGAREKQLELNRKIQSKGKVVKGAYICRNAKCRSDECYAHGLQCKSGDEGMSTFILCSKCGTRYRIN